MFTGIVEELGAIVAVDETAVGSERAVRVTIDGPLVSSDVAVGDSIAVSGVCLTVVDATSGRFTADVMLETLTRSTLRDAGVGTSVNLERTVTLQTRLGGHLVQGHVDGTGTVIHREHTPEWDVVEFALPAELARYVVAKGSIAVDGVSLTIAAVGAESFSVSLIPTTLQRTTLGAKAIGAAVNLEVDVMAKYAERLLGFATVEAHS
ncbi:MAG TPA: riboflavin synthase [Acidothermaceae bacterium]|nr:riboflavin synthase [Acidothermaceae bacterium]